MATPEDQEVWRDIKEMVAESLPEYQVVGIDRLQNTELWRQYTFRCHQLADQDVDGDANEKTLFHYSMPQVLRKIIEGGFEPRLGSEGEYGA